jgi:protein TonB
MEYAPPARTSAALVPVTDEHQAEAPAKSAVTFVMPGAADGGLALQQLLAEIDAEADAEASRPGVASRALSLLNDHRRPAIIAGVLVLLGAAFTVARARGTQDEVDPLGDMMRTSAPAAAVAPGAGTTPPTYGADGVVRTAATGNTGGTAIVPLSSAAPTASDAATHRAEPDRARDAGESRSTSAAERAPARATEKAPETPREQPKAASPATTTMSGPLTTMPTLRLDSITRAAAAATATATQDPLASRLTSMTAKSAITETATSGSARGSSTQPARLIGSVPVARYPQSLRSSGVQGEVRVTFEVDTTGRPDMRSLVILKSDHDLFTSAVRNVVPEMRFVPAEVDGKKARWLVRMPFVFSVAK